MRRAFILAGGLGTRLLPYTTVLPKPLLPLGQRSILEHLLEGVAASGLSRATISLGYLGHLVEAVIGDGSRYGVDVDFTHESSPMGTAGALRLIPDPQPDDHILVLNGDTYTDFRYSKAFDEMERTSADALVVCVKKSMPVDLGILDGDAESGAIADGTFGILDGTDVGAHFDLVTIQRDGRQIFQLGQLIFLF